MFLGKESNMKVVIVSSSTRNDRVSHRIALALEKQIEKKGHVATIIDLLELDLPRFAERFPLIEEKPANWQSTMDMLLASDGIIFLTPEYNGSFSSGLKNFIDVFAKQGFRDKPIGVATGSTGAMGGVRAAYQLQQVILSLFAYPQPQMLTVGEMQNKFDESGELVDENFRNRFEGYIDKFLEFTTKIAS
jgi:NAD(P)H-dependent FMN reductase